MAKLFHNPDSQVWHEEDRRVAYRRGKILTVVVVVVTGIFFLWSSAGDLWQVPPADKASIHGSNKWVDFGFSCFVIGITCACAWQGGKTSTGCLTILYSILLFTVGVGIGVGTMNATTVAYQTAANLFNQWNWSKTGNLLRQLIFPAATAGWTLFAFWVLVFSRDARFYRESRRQDIRSVADTFNEWHLRRP